MRAQQRKPILMLLNRLHRHIPSHDGVALLAVGAHLAAVDVGMAIGALLAHVGEDRPAVTLRAGDRLVHAAKRIARGVVVELRIIADRLPAAERVTVLARDGKRAVGTARASRACRLRHWSGSTQTEREREQQQETYCDGDHVFRFLLGPTACTAWIYEFGRRGAGQLLLGRLVGRKTAVPSAPTGNVSRFGLYEKLHTDVVPKTSGAAYFRNFVAFPLWKRKHFFTEKSRKNFRLMKNATVERAVF